MCARCRVPTPGLDINESRLSTMRSPTPTPHPHRSYEKAWSPASRDPRCSRRTPDRLLARINSKRPINALVGDASSWACGILHAKARKLAVYDPKRTKIVSMMEKKADAVEDATVSKEEVVKVATPSCAPSLVVQETVAYMQPLRTRSATTGVCFPCGFKPLWE